MFFAAIVALPFLAGLVAGTLSPARRTTHVLAASCVALGLAGAVVIGVDDSTTDRAASIAFALAGGAVAAALVYAGHAAARAARRSVRRA
jgi:hypothetical protein